MPSPSSSPSPPSPSDYTIRPATPRDVPYLASISLSASPSPSPSASPSPSPSLLPLSALLAAVRSHTLWVATFAPALFPASHTPDTPLAFLVARALDGGLFVVDVAVARREQGRGLGRRLVGAAEGYARGVGMRRVSAVVGAETGGVREWWRGLGYVERRAELVGWGHVGVLEHGEGEEGEDREEGGEEGEGGKEERWVVVVKMVGDEEGDGGGDGRADGEFGGGDDDERSWEA